MKAVYINEDNEHFYACHPAEDMTESGVRELVDFYAETGCVKGILFCANLQRALYDSDVWERFRNIRDEFSGPYTEHLQLLSERGIDHLKIWLERASELGMEGWISMRMNDSHGLKETAVGDTACRCYAWASEFWKQHPELRRAPYRFERDWEGGFNYLRKEVRDYHLALVRELLERYDMFGLECDWMRWGMHFTPGFEREGQKVLTDFVRAVRKIADEAEKRWNHPIQLAHRLPADMVSALNSGYDFTEWHRCGCADMVTLCCFCDHGEYDPQIRLWKKLMPGCRFNMQIETKTGPYPGADVASDDFLRGGASCAWNAGADGIYLFNFCYQESKRPAWLQKRLREISEPEALIGKPRKMIPACSGFYIAGECSDASLPVPLIQPAPAHDLGRMEDTITVRLNAGIFAPEEPAVIRLGFDAAADPESLAPMKVWLNSVPLGAPVVKQCHISSDFPGDTAFVLTYHVPKDSLHAEFNAVELLPPAIPGHLVWAELSFNE